MIEGHGDDLYRYGGRVRHNFSTNIIADRDHSGLIAYLAERLGTIGSYPEPRPFTLEKRLAEQLGCGAENVAVTNGATDAVYRIAQIHRGGMSAISRPTFREYQDACALHEYEICFFDRPEDIPSGASLIWLCNPNNPTGSVLPKEEILRLSATYPDAWIIVDQAYADYTSLPVLTPKEAIESGNIILLSSLTKRYSVPGLRIGYLTAPDNICAEIRRQGIPWAVNAPAIEAALYLLAHEEDYPIDCGRLHSEAVRLADRFRKIGIECTDTDCNFILCKLPEGMQAGQLKEYLVEEGGLLIRDASNFEGLDERYFRVAAQSERENDLLADMVEKWIIG
ncbi:MAG: aminotransferase class I/II-fold pyridoxal phosphate-dependent enzyme [Muribaculaceae bacterium]|nr:aminotransferase class I/II-fold pyridoxal phosphate-dependent enzyme [Muribaculaceae bacterium]